MNDKPDAVGRLRGAYKDLQLAIRDIAEERLSEVWFGEWSTKDMMAHLASRDEMAVEDVKRVGRGHIPCLAAFKVQDADRLNEFLLAPRRRWPLVQVRFESELYHERLIEALNALPESMFQPGQAVYTYCAAAAAHYREHAQQIKDWYHVTAYGGKEPDQWAGRSLSTN
ncbi:MAG: ClbS/DfsB family four-helix bundle protein [Chloroflexi bacterium]|nr:MAG: ClbS/DfsB family four-helix bundle protein [Chloroflexota bacterium]